MATMQRMPPAWTCHICGKLRPDILIEVLRRDVSHEIEPHLPDGTMWLHVRYCADNPVCRHKAKTWNFGVTKHDQGKSNLR